MRSNFGKTIQRGEGNLEGSATRILPQFALDPFEEAQNVRVEYPVHLLPLDAHRQRVKRLMRAWSPPWCSTRPVAFP
jgi:hypothetical protein